MFIDVPYNNEYMPDFDTAARLYDEVFEKIREGKIYSAFALGAAGLCETIKMCFGNDIGIDFVTDLNLFAPRFGSLVLEVTDDFEMLIAQLIGRTTDKKTITCGEDVISIKELRESWEAPLAEIFPSLKEETPPLHEKYIKRNQKRPKIKIAKPRVFIPVFPGTNCEYDSVRAFEKHGAITDMFVVNNESAKDIETSIEGLANGINNSQIVMLPGGFSAGDEPDGSAKFIAATFRNQKVKDAIHELLNMRDGLMLGICNGFQALIKLGLVPYGEICDTLDIKTTLACNSTGQHISCMAETEIVSVLSPWMMYHNAGERHILPISHGEGRFTSSPEIMDNLLKNGQIATQYSGFNPNGSAGAIEGITSPDGRVFGKMAHSERCGLNVAKNIPGDKEQMIFKAGVDYFI